jgi:hypothetical protein
MKSDIDIRSTVGDLAVTEGVSDVSTPAAQVMSMQLDGYVRHIDAPAIVENWRRRRRTLGKVRSTSRLSETHSANESIESARILAGLPYVF